jgi:hypothetical protein
MLASGQTWTDNFSLTADIGDIKAYLRSRPAGKPGFFVVLNLVLAPFHPPTRRMAPFEKVKWPLLNLIDCRT